MKYEGINEILSNDYAMCVKELKKAENKINKAIEYFEYQLSQLNCRLD